MIQVKNLSKSYGPRSAVCELNFSIEKGEVVGFLGPNGAGKTTTMNLLTGFFSPSDGEVWIDGISMQKNPEAAKQRLGYLPEQPPLYPDMLVRDYLCFVARLRGLSRARLKQRLEFVQDRCGLGNVYGRLIAHLSKGYRQRVGIAQALIADPEVIILDEPTSGLDPIQIIEIRELIRDLGRDHTLILSTHILPEVTMTCQKIMIINDGKIVAQGEYDALSARLRKSHRVYVRASSLCLAHVEGLKSLSEVLSVSQEGAGGDGAWIVESKPDFDIEAEIVWRAAQEGWGLKELRPDRLSLEEVFLKLTHEEASV